MQDPASTSPEPRDTDLAALAAAYPGWLFTAAWVAVGSGPDVRVLIATRDSAALTALDAAGLAEKIDAAGRAR